MAAPHPDPSFDRQLRRSLAVADRGAADLDEVLGVARRVRGGDVAGWEREWQRAADQALSTGDELLGADDLDGACRAFLRAAEYYRQAGFFSSHDDSRYTLDTAHVNAFRAAMPLLPVPAEIVEIFGTTGNDGDPNWLRGYLFRVAGAADRPLVLATVGPDSTAEAGYTELAIAVIERGMNCLILAGPGGYHVRSLLAAIGWIAQRPDLHRAPLVLLPGSDPCGDELTGVAQSEPLAAGPVPLELGRVEPRT